MADHRIAWDCGDFSVAAIGAMCAPAHFTLGGGKIVQPFAIAPWGDNPEGDPRYASLPPLLRRLRGEWPCVPFGMPQARSDLPPDWLPPQSDGRGVDDFFHGPSSNLAYAVEREGPGTITLVLDYPHDHPIRRVRRTIRGVPGRAALDFTLEIEPRMTVSLPVGLHPTFRLPEATGAATLEIAGADARVHAYPVDAEPGISRLAPGGVSNSLRSVPDASGGEMDLTRLPLPVSTEELVLVGPVSGHAGLVNHAEAYRVDLRWDPAAFPSVNLWLSNRGRTAYPWNGRHLAVGIEPVAAPWDLGVAVARTPDQPLSRRGIRSAVAFTAGAAWSTSYSIEVRAIEP